MITNKDGTAVKLLCKQSFDVSESNISTHSTINKTIIKKGVIKHNQRKKIS